jgi:hypothetical protein
MRKYYSFSLHSQSCWRRRLSRHLRRTSRRSPWPRYPANSEGIISYTPADFAAARPNTALDMINRMPGFSFDGGDNVRGFAGAAGNVLIDGARPTSKTDGLGDTLAPYHRLTRSSAST